MALPVLGADRLMPLSPDSTVIKGPREVVGRAGGSLIVTCQYDARYKWDQKWWCRGMVGSGCLYRVETTGAEPVVRKDRVSIWDDKSQSRFTVTIERLRDRDAGTYWCGIQTTKLDLNFSITVTINPARTTITVFTMTTTTTNTPTTAATTEETTDAPRVTRALSNTMSLLSSFHFLLLVFLKVPLLVVMMGAVVWTILVGDSSMGKFDQGKFLAGSF
ncbi:CMRF35-like molecule 5 [Sorex fumeus]|uniref:CMRF35-like molecule 5 n=1 Tax=Sorex fumeus TaxID=62283 RepID=UPI0024AE057D|nr:CMRF35-like molecule 5 [Sorex fumeus]